MLNCHCPETKVTPPWGHVAPLPPPTDLSLRPWHQVISKINLQSFMPGLTILPKETTIMVDPHQCWTKLTPLYHCLWLEIPMGVYRLHQWWTHLVSLHLPVDQPQGKWSNNPSTNPSIYLLLNSDCTFQVHTGLQSRNRKYRSQRTPFQFSWRRLHFWKLSSQRNPSANVTESPILFRYSRNYSFGQSFFRFLNYLF